MAKTPPRTKDSFGGCTFDHASPDQAKLTSGTKVINLVLSFEEALKLNLAVQEALSDLNKLHRAVKVNKAAGMKLIVHMNTNRLTVDRGRVRQIG